MWAVRSRCMKEGKYHQKISDISPIYHRYISDISPIYRRSITDILPPETIFSKNLWYIYIADILAIFMKISPLRFFSTKYRVDASWYTIYRRYIADISQHFPWVKPKSSYQPRVMDKPAWKKCFYLDYGEVSTLWLKLLFHESPLPFEHLLKNQIPHIPQEKSWSGSTGSRHA